jgi:EF-P beta-lysylation protein EpmB
MEMGLASATAWRTVMAEALRDVDALWQALDLPSEMLPAAREQAKVFPLMVTSPFLSRMQPSNPNDPLLRQVLPLAEEGEVVPGYGPDPVGEGLVHDESGLLRKYQGRALLICTGSCAVHCRYCFRRHFPYELRPRGKRWWASACERIVADDSIEEVILSGGDPLVLPDHELGALVADIAAIPHIERLRIHTRLPIMIPQRIDSSLLAWLEATRLETVMVIHSNHPQELDAEVAAAFGRLSDAGVHLLNQAVLMRGINDHAQTQLALSKRLLQCRVLPYYIHALDPVQGAAHFAVPDEEARAIMDELHRMASGFLVPRLVREVPGEAGKRWLWPATTA